MSHVSYSDFTVKAPDKRDGENDGIMPIALLCIPRNTARGVLGGFIYFEKTNSVGVYNLDTFLAILREARKRNKDYLTSSGELLVSSFLSQDTNFYDYIQRSLAYKNFNEYYKTYTWLARSNCPYTLPMRYSPAIPSGVVNSRLPYIDVTTWTTTNTLGKVYIRLDCRLDPTTFSIEYKLIFPDLHVAWVDRTTYAEIEADTDNVVSIFDKGEVNSVQATPALDLTSAIGKKNLTLNDFSMRVARDMAVTTEYSPINYSMLSRLLFADKPFMLNTLTETCKKLVNTHEPNERLSVYSNTTTINITYGTPNFTSSGRRSFSAALNMLTERMHLVAVFYYNGNPVLGLFHMKGFSDNYTSLNAMMRDIAELHDLSKLRGINEWSTIDYFDTTQEQSGYYVTALHVQNDFDVKYNFDFDTYAKVTKRPESDTDVVSCKLKYYNTGLLRAITKYKNTVAAINLMDKEN